MNTEKEKLFAECYQQYRDQIKRYIAARINHPDYAEDLTQDVFTRLWSHIDFVNPETANALIFKIAYNLIVDKIRRYNKYTDIISYLYYTQETCQNTTENMNQYAELSKMHMKVIKSLPEKRQKIYTLSFYEGMSQSEIAEAFSIAPRTVEKQMILARKVVRNYIKEKYLKPTECLFCQRRETVFS